MRNLYKYTIMILLGLSFLGSIGCSGKKEDTNIPHRYRYRNYGNGGSVPFTHPYDFNHEVYPGRIVGRPQNEFQNGVANLISSFMNPDDPTSGISTVSGKQGDYTGVWFQGRLKVHGGFNPNRGHNSSLLSDSFINVLIWDQYAGQERGDGVVPGINIGPAHVVNSSIQGQNVNLKFEYRDVNGEILGYLRLEGSYNQKEFHGRFYFENERFHNPAHNGRGYGNRGARGQMGGFYIPTCKIFECH